MNSCSGCDAKWVGTSLCHCPMCHRTFQSITGFDRHQPTPGQIARAKRDGKEIMCGDPFDRGMTWRRTTAWHQIWMLPRKQVAYWEKDDE